VTASAPVVTVNFSADPTSVVSNGYTTLTWSSTNATACTESGDYSLGSIATSGTRYYGPTNGNWTMVMTCTGLGGSIARAVLTVGYVPPPYITFYGSPTSITAGTGQAIKFTWQTQWATSCIAEGTPGGNWNGTVATSGVVSVFPTNTSNNPYANGSYAYYLQCTGPGGTTNSPYVYLTVNMNPSVSATSDPSSQTAIASQSLQGLLDKLANLLKSL
jgi:hypothetical protein